MGSKRKLDNNQQVTEEIEKYLETNDNENTAIQKLRDTAKAVLRSKVYSDTSLPQETRKISNNLTIYLKQLKKNKQNPKSVEGNKS